MLQQMDRLRIEEVNLTFSLPLVNATYRKPVNRNIFPAECKQMFSKRFAGNFIKSAHIRMEQLRRQSQGTVRLTWLVYLPGYIARETEDRGHRAAFPCTTAEIAARAGFK